jgi:hypothetical protein
MSSTTTTRNRRYRAVHRGSFETLAVGTVDELRKALINANLADVAIYTSLAGRLEGLVGSTASFLLDANAMQDRINGLDAQPQALAAEVRRVAEATHAQYPQFRGHWDGWKLGRMTRDLETKGGHIVAGDIVLFREVDLAPLRPDLTVYSVRRGCDVAVPSGWGYVEEVC